jgi:hypothetical protein
MTRLRTLLILAGVAGLGYAALGLLTDPDVKLFGVLLFLVAVLAVHDGLWMPAVLGAGALIDRFVPARRRRPVRVGLSIGAAVGVVGLPLVLGPGPPGGLPYGRNLALTLGVLVLVTLIVASRKKVERPGPGDPGPGGQ